LQSNGYTTAHIGKWMNGSIDGIDTPRIRGGFNYRNGFTGISRNPFLYSNYENTSLTTNNTKYATSHEVDAAIAWISAQEGPWYCQLSFTVIHATNMSIYPPSSLYSITPEGVEGTNGGYNGLLASLEAMDTEIGRLLAAIDLENTLVIFTGDNGTGMPTPNAPAGRAKASGSDNSIRCPLVIYYPGIAKPGSTNATLVQNPDLYPTIFGILGMTPASTKIQGRDISGACRGEIVPQKIQLTGYGMSILGGDFAGQLWGRATDGRFALLRYSDATPDKLFDLSVDPYEQNNLMLAALSGPASKALGNLRYEITKLTWRDGEQEIVIADYTAPSVVTGGIRVVRGGVTVSKPELATSATITAPLKTGATTYTLWKKVGDFGTWQDSGLTPAIGATVVFTDPTPTGRTYYRITNDAPEP